MTAKLTRAILDVGIVTDDGAATLAFFCDLLGFSEIGEMPFPGVGLVRRLACGETVVRVFEPAKPPARLASTEGFAHETGLRYLTLHVSNIEELVNQAVMAGYPNPVPVRILRPGTFAAQISDGRGITVELMQIEE